MNVDWGAAMKNRILIITLAILTVGLFVSANILAGEDPDPEVPPPSQQQTAVGRVSVVHGQVSTAHGDAGEWTAATVNTPLVPGDRVSTADHSRAELQLDPATVMRLEERTEARVADLEQNKMQLQLASGLVDFSVLNGAQADVEIDTPNVGVHPLAPGLYRIQVNSDSDTQLIVRRGEAEVLTNQGTTKVEAGQMIQIHGTDDPEYRVVQAPGGDDFDKWSSDRDRQIQSVQASPHSDPSYVGSSDLDTYGQWSEVPDQGWCWTPQVDIGWTPYSVGHWGWEPSWGWTWIGGEPWGWVPYHYGSWFFFGGLWRWRPSLGGWGRGGFFAGNRWGAGARFMPGGGFINGRPHAYAAGFGMHSNFASPGRAAGGPSSFRGSSSSWHGFQRANQSSRWPAAVNGGGHASPQGGQYNWQRYASPSSYSGARQGYTNAPRSYAGGGYAGRSGSSYYGGGSRPPLNLNPQIMRQRAPSGGYNGGGRSYSAPSGNYGGGRGYSAPSGGHTYSAPRSSGGGGGSSHSSGGGGGGHSSGGHGGGRR